MAEGTVARAEADPEPRKEGVTAAVFRHLVDDHKTDEERKHEQEREAAALARREQVKQLIDTHITDTEWNAVLHRAREAAEEGEKEYQLLQFPSDLCSDDGRAINAPDPDWPKTLRGEAGEVYALWERDLKPGGFHLIARVVSFPDGVPGDIGLFLIWGE
jgi:hypothetical protein